MKKKYTFLFFIFAFVSLKSQNINMANGSQTITCSGSANFYDSGGNGSNYANNQNFTLTIYPNTPTLCLQFVFTTFATESCCDNLTIYNGSNTASPLIGSYAGTTLPPTITSNNGAITFVWSSDGSVVGAGWVATINCVACPPPPPFYLMSAGIQTLTCPPTYSLFYDSGGPSGNYTNNENLTKTFSVTPGNCLRINFTSFSTENCCDRLRIFDGPNGFSPLIGTYNGALSPGLIIASGTSITFSFTSDASVINTGWTATISCVPQCLGMPVGGTANSVTSPCPPAGSVNIGVTGASAPGCGLTVQWQSAPTSSGAWTNVGGATSNVISVPTSSNTFYRRLITCGINTATSTVVSATSSTTLACNLSAYTAALTSYNFENFVGTSLPTTDDVLLGTLTMLGFQFCYGGSSYWGGYAASNGAFVFDGVPCFPNILTTTFAAAGVSTGFTIPSPAPVNGTSIPRNAVLATWHDLHPNSTATVATSRIQYTTLGVSPNRRFILSYENIPMFSPACAAVVAMRYSAQIKIFETTNEIEIHIRNKQPCTTFNNGEAVMGLHSFDGLTYIPPVNATAHNAVGGAGPYNNWSMTNTAYRFSATCASAVCAVLPVGFKNFYGQNYENYNKLNFETAEESNMDYFFVERSNDAVNFTKIATLLPNNKPSNYNYIDYNYKMGMINYYRITGVERSGNAKSTYIIPINDDSGDLAVSDLAPNPTTNDFNLVVNSKKVKTITVCINDLYGRRIKLLNHAITVGLNTIYINSLNLQSGVYVIKITDELQKTLSQQKLVINN